MKFALISHQVPPSGTGQSLVIYRMLTGLSPDNYCLVSTERYEGDQPKQAPSQRLPVNYYHLPPPLRFRRGHRFGLHRLREGINIPFAVLQHARRIGRVIRQEKCEAVVACTGDVTLLPAAYLASRRAGIPFYAYVFDHYFYREWEDPSASFWARRFEPLVMKGAAAVLAPNEILRDDLRERFHIEAAVIHNSFDISPYETCGSEAPERAASDDIRIVYTGAVYEAHYDAFYNLLTAIASLSRPGVRLHMYTDRPRQDLEDLGISGPVVYHPTLVATEVPRVQIEADILFLPLAFRSPYPDLVRTSATTKLGEYLAARRPIIVHAPRESFVAWYFRQHDCGVVVDDNDPELLAGAIDLILNDNDLRQRIIANGWERARIDFSISAARAAFTRALGLNGIQGD